VEHHPPGPGGGVDRLAGDDEVNAASLQVVVETPQRRLTWLACSGSNRQPSDP